MYNKQISMTVWFLVHELWIVSVFTDMIGLVKRKERVGWDESFDELIIGQLALLSQ